MGKGLLFALFSIIFPVLAVSCTTDPGDPLVPFSAMIPESHEPEVGLPLKSTAVQRKYDRTHREHWVRILSGIERILDEFDQAFQSCPMTTPNDTGGDHPLTSAETPSLFAQTRKRMIAASEWVNHELAQLDPMQNQSALFLPARALNRNIRTVLFSSLELSCRSPELYSGRMKAIRQRLSAFREHLDLH